MQEAFFDYGSESQKIINDLNQYIFTVAPVIELETIEIELGEDAPVIRIVNLVLKQAVQKNISDVHIEPLGNELQVRFRFDGILQKVLSLPAKSFPAISSRLKIMANLDISEKRVPQDGRMRLIIDGREIDFRVSTIPSIYGEKIVLRVLDRANAIMSLEKLGFNPANEKRIRSLISEPTDADFTARLVRKTTTLYSILTELNSIDRNIVTLEDPVEYSLPGITQIQINPKAGLTFPTGLRSVLRQDPDIIMVGEMRDTETANLGVRAALTGHLFFSTLHTNNAASTVARMVNMGIENYLLSSSLVGIVSQRLIRCICPKCCQPYNLDEQTAIQLNIPAYTGKQFFAPKGCPDCYYSGYLGRTSLQEVMILGPEIHHAITNKIQSEDKLEKIAISEGMIPITTDGVNKAHQGVTSLQEVIKGVFLTNL